jgi:alpha-glucoside transport system substrate-binding protein
VAIAAGQSWTALGSCDGTEGFFGFSYNVNVKSLVWYVPENFQDAGYRIPTSMEDLRALTEQMASDGFTPWCIGLGSQAATGWPATDWVEDLLLRMQPPEVYDGWVTNEIPFDDPRIISAIEEFGWFARNDDFVSGGAGSVASTDFRDSPRGLFSAPPQCMMHRQASFIPAFFPEGIIVGEDVDFFYFPSYANADLGNPVLGAGTLVTITEDSEATRGLIEFLKTPIAHEIWMAIETQGFLTPHIGVSLDAYHNDSLRRQGLILRDATTFRFDGSDLMPGAVGAGSFWTGMVDYAGGADATEIAKQIEASWKALD